MADEKKARPGQTYWLIVVRDESDKAPQVIRCGTIEAFSNIVEQTVLDATGPLWLFGFRGKRIPIAAPRPLCAFEIDGKIRQVSAGDPEFDDTGRIVPLIRRAEDNT